MLLPRDGMALNDTLFLVINKNIDHKPFSLWFWVILKITFYFFAIACICDETVLQKWLLWSPQAWRHVIFLILSHFNAIFVVVFHERKQGNSTEWCDNVSLIYIKTLNLTFDNRVFHSCHLLDRKFTLLFFQLKGKIQNIIYLTFVLKVKYFQEQIIPLLYNWIGSKR